MKTSKKTHKTYSTKYFADLKSLYSTPYSMEEKKEDAKEKDDGESMLQRRCEDTA